MATSTPRIRVVAVDDSVVVRRLVSDVLQSDPEIEVVATSSNGRLGVDAVRRFAPDVVVMDIEMPVMTGIEAVREIRTTDRRTPIIMFSTLTERGARATFEALDAGATDYVTKPGQASAVGNGLEAVRTELIPKVRALAGRPPHPGGPGARSTTTPVRSALAAARAAAGRPVVPAQTGRTGAGRPGGPNAWLAGASASRVFSRRPSLIAIGSSTGGPEALARVLGALPATLTVPVVVVQHMPAEFTQLLSERLDRTCAVRVQHAVDGEPLRRGPSSSPAAAATSRSSASRAASSAASATPRPRTSAAPRSTSCSAPSPARSAVACSPSSSRGWARTGPPVLPTSPPPAPRCGRRTRPRRSSGACPAASSAPASPPTSCRCPPSAPPSPRAVAGPLGAAAALPTPAGPGGRIRG